MSAVSVLPRGRAFVRKSIAAGVASFSGGNPSDIAERRWGAFHAEQMYKSAVAALTQEGTDPHAMEFFNLVFEKTIPGRLMGIRRIPINVRVLAMVSGVQGYWVGEANPKPISRPTLAGATLRSAKVAAIICATKESLQAGGAIMEAGLQLDLERAVIAAIDEAFIDAANAGVADERPAAVTYDAPAIAATGDPSADLVALVSAFEGDLSSAVIVTDPVTATRYATIRDAAGGFMFLDIGPRGGSLIGIPVITSRSSPQNSNGGQIALIDPTGIAYGGEGITVNAYEHATLAMSDTPESDPEMVSLWQTNTIAFKSEMFSNWEVQRAGGVAVLTGV